MTPEILAEFSAALQKECLPGVWSKGIAMSRDCPIQEDSRTTDEIALRIQIAGRPVSPKVTLWPEEQDWYCDCGDRNDLCVHVVAAAIALKMNLTRKGPSPEQASSRVWLEYRFTRNNGALAFERFLHEPDGAGRILSESLVSWVGGIHSGRIQAPVVPATKEDFAVDAALGSRKTGVLDRETLERLLPLLQVFSSVTLDGSPVLTEGRSVSWVAEVEDESNGVRLKIRLPESVSETFSNGAVLLTDGKLRPLKPSGLAQHERERLSGAGMFFPPGEFPTLAAELIPSLQSRIPVELHSSRLPAIIDEEPHIVLRIQTVGDDTISVIPIIAYGRPAVAEVHQGELVANPKTNTIPRRKKEEEQRLLRGVQSDLQISPVQNTRFSGSAAASFLARAKNWNTEGDAIGKMSPQGDLKAFIKITDSGDLSFSFNTAFVESAADPMTVLQSWQARDPHVRLLDGTWARIPTDWLNKHGEKVLQLLEAREKHGKLPRWFLPAATQLTEELGNRPPPNLESLRRGLADFNGIPESPLPDGLYADLRSYQKKGVDWLCFLGKNEMGALLADDMGLGKTLQTLCAIKGKTLVVAPTSVTHAWISQIKAFRPGLRFNLYHGSDRSLDSSADVTITTYAILRLDRESLTQQKWDTAVLDEAQIIRNPDSQAARAAHAIQANIRIALTGTPVENRLDDLWSQFEFLNPGLLGPRENIQSQTAEQLRTRIRPFVLRRLKRDVAPELPPRTESVMYCELSTEERALYNAVLAASRQDALKLLEAGGNTFSILETLLRMRQACCHPSLLPGQMAAHSSKIDLLLESLETSAAEGHRALVFSQWTSLLDLIVPELRERGIEFLRLDGTTSNRSEIVNRFQSDSGPPVLLISLKAGGVGLTLTAADHVYLVDPWWNPAVENQAADRAHRIGQEKPVMIYRLAARDTVEEKVLELQQRKLQLASSVLEGGAASLDLTRDDLLALLT